MLASCSALPRQGTQFIYEKGYLVMSSILEEFARGNISPDVGCFKKDSQYGRTMKTLCETEDRLMSVLGGELKETFKQHVDAQAESNLITGIDKFIYGYRLGVLMTMEVFNGREAAIFGGKDC